MEKSTEGGKIRVTDAELSVKVEVEVEVERNNSVPHLRVRLNTK